jgi:uncharacterized membrane protein (DUF4010 family)
MFEFWDDRLTGTAVALGIGLLVGAERERRKGQGPQRAAFGVRSFAVVALTGAVTASLQSPVLLAIAGAMTVALAVAGYLRTADDDPGVTTEIAWCLVFLLGFMAVSMPALAAGLGALLALLLASRPWLHRLIRDRLSERESLDAIFLASAALIALPLLPNRAIDPWGAVNPQLIGRLTVVVLFLNAVGYVALRALGNRLALPITGLLGGFVSSTATIASLGQRAREQPGSQPGAVAGAALSSVATVVQLAAILAVAAPAMLTSLGPALLAAGSVAIMYALPFLRRAHSSAQTPLANVGRAFDLRHAVTVAGAIAMVLLIGSWIAATFGARGALAGIAVAGFADVHAASASAAALLSAGRLPADTAILSVVAAFAANTFSKSLAAALAGGRAFAARIVPGLVLMLVALAAVAFGVR